MPSFVLDVFGPVRMPVVYGTILTGWSAGGIIGPQLAAIIRDRFPANPGVYTYIGGAILLAIGVLFTFMLSDKRFEVKGTAGACSGSKRGINLLFTGNFPFNGKS